MVVPGRVEQEPRRPRGEALHSALPSARLGPKFHPPSARAGIVVRDALVERLLESDASVITLVAPPGYGKTTLLAQWARAAGAPSGVGVVRQGRRRPRRTVDRRRRGDLCGLGPGPGAARGCSRRAAAGIAVVPAFVAAIEPIGAPMTIVLDHLEHTRTTACPCRDRRVRDASPRRLAAGAGLARAACRSRCAGFVPKVASPSSGRAELAMSTLTKPRRCSWGRASRRRQLDR